MSEIQQGNAVAKPTVKEIRTQELAALERRRAAASGKSAETGMEVSVGRSLADIAARANQRTILLTKELKGFQLEPFSYSASMRRFDRLQSMEGLVNLTVLNWTMPWTSINTCNPYSQLSEPSHQEEHDLVLQQASSFRDLFFMPETYPLYQYSLLSKLSGDIMALKIESKDDCVRDDIETLRSKISDFADRFYGYKNINPLVITKISDIGRIDPREVDVEFNKFQPISAYGSKLRFSFGANPINCASVPQEIMQEHKDKLREILRDTWSLSHKISCLIKGHPKGKLHEINSSIQSFTKNMLKTSDQLLLRELSESQAAKN